MGIVLTYGPWDPPLAAFDDVNHHHHHQLECFSTASELRDPLLHALAELEAARGAYREDLLCMEHEAARLVACTAAERDDLRLPEKGRLVEVVVSAGPLLQTLLLVSPLPRWSHPPPPASAAQPQQQQHAYPCFQMSSSFCMQPTT
ncbi:hypothetical protein ZWY2020_002079 [Hordeum vulgare]|nr:hypothetical protein ZWY2020_002079 [Hordeum vulgare]